MFTRRVALLACVAAAWAVLASTTSHAGPPLTVSNNLTFNRVLALPGTTLPAGTYVFERDASSSIVRVLTPNYQQLLFVGFTTMVARPRGFRPTVLFGEAQTGEAIPIVAWYPVGSSQGHQFLYR